MTDHSSRQYSPFRRLGLPDNATLTQVEEAFTRLAKAAHPDNGGSLEEFRMLTLAREACVSTIKAAAGSPPVEGLKGSDIFPPELLQEGMFRTISKYDPDFLTITGPPTIRERLSSFFRSPTSHLATFGGAKLILFVLSMVFIAVSVMTTSWTAVVSGAGVERDAFPIEVFLGVSDSWTHIALIAGLLIVVAAVSCVAIPEDSMVGFVWVVLIVVGLTSAALGHWGTVILVLVVAAPVGWLSVKD